MPSEILHFENARFAQQLFNNDPRNLQALEEQLDVKATAREVDKTRGLGGWRRVGKATLPVLETSLKAGTPVRNREFSFALNVMKSDGPNALQGCPPSGFKPRPGKPSSLPRRWVKKYIEAIRRHDITFGIGPAWNRQDLPGRRAGGSRVEKRKRSRESF